jgi:hypothetical protein
MRRLANGRTRPTSKLPRSRRRCGMTRSIMIPCLVSADSRSRGVYRGHLLCAVCLYRSNTWRTGDASLLFWYRRPMKSSGVPPEEEAKTRTERFISAMEWVCLAVMVALFVMRVTGNSPPPPWGLLLAAFALGTYVVLFCVDLWLDWKRGKRQKRNASPDLPAFTAK